METKTDLRGNQLKEQYCSSSKAQKATFSFPVSNH